MAYKYKRHKRHKEKSFLTVCGLNENTDSVLFANETKEVNCIKCLSLMENNTLFNTGKNKCGQKLIKDGK